MTTKRARSRRLVPSEHKCNTYLTSAKDGPMFSFGRHLTPGWSNRLHIGWRVSLILNGVVTRRITARTRLALHDAILRAGWPSPWREVAP